jgi:hypothetical protein
MVAKRIDTRDRVVGNGLVQLARASDQSVYGTIPPPAVVINAVDQPRRIWPICGVHGSLRSDVFR